MKRILHLAQSVRDYVNNASLYNEHFQYHPDQWNALCVAMDTLTDTCLAMGYYEDNGIGNENGEKYLKLYGLLQAVFLQQESIRQLHRTFLKNDLKPSSDTAWMKIRNLRHLTVAHPIGKDAKDYCFISQITIRSDGFQLVVWNKDKSQNEIEDVDLGTLYDSYKSEIVSYLEKIHEAQVRQWGMSKC